MKLWLLDSVAPTPQWDVVTALVVRAETEQAAREIAQSRGGRETGRLRDGDPRTIPYWTDPSLSSCARVRASGESGVVLIDSFYP